MNHFKYKKPAAFDFPQRSWPGKTLSKAPAWCSVDLRDGNQSLNVPMLLDEKLEFFKFLCETGFKEIEIGFPSANETEFKFARELITRRLIPDNVSVQVLTQSRGHIIERTFEALEGVKQAIVHLYNSTSPLQREVVFKKSKDEIISLAVNGAVQMVALAERYGSERFMFEYSPESFSQTEPDFAVEICNAVTDVWRGKKIIINLPFTVETCLPNVHADQIEYMCGRLNGRDNLTVSLHAHNDRGTAVAATELGLLAGADRVEGTLFGNGERTGNADIITLAMNLFSHGIDPKLDFSKIDKAIDIYEKSTGLRVHQRHPYAGDLVYTAFSGSHQDAIRKGMHRMADSGCGVSFWNVPYLPIDPCDVGRSYDPIIRVNSQSGGAATAYVLERNFGINMPKRMYRDFGPVVYEASAKSNAELSPADVYRLFEQTYINSSPVKLIGYREKTNGGSHVEAAVEKDQTEFNIEGSGNGVLDAFCNALRKELGIDFEIVYYTEHSLESGAGAQAITYVEISSGGKTFFGAGISSNIIKSSMRAVTSAVNNSIKSS